MTMATKTTNVKTKTATPKTARPKTAKQQAATRRAANARRAAKRRQERQERQDWLGTVAVPLLVAEQATEVPAALEPELRFDLMPPAALRAAARRFGLGAVKFGDRTWESGGRQFQERNISRLIGHLQAYMETGDTIKPNSDAIVCRAMMLCFYEYVSPLVG